MAGSVGTANFKLKEVHAAGRALGCPYFVDATFVRSASLFAPAVSTCCVQQFIDFLIACRRVHFMCKKERWWMRQACKRSPQVFNHLTSHDQVSASGLHVSGFADDKELSLDTSAS
jgi:hypothetical protein